MKQATLHQCNNSVSKYAQLPSTLVSTLSAKESKRAVYKALNALGYKTKCRLHDIVTLHLVTSFYRLSLVYRAECTMSTPGYNNAIKSSWNYGYWKNFRVSDALVEDTSYCTETLTTDSIMLQQQIKFWQKLSHVPNMSVRYLWFVWREWTFRIGLHEGVSHFAWDQTPQQIQSWLTARRRSAGSSAEPSQWAANRFFASSMTALWPALPIRPITRLRSIAVRWPNNHSTAFKFIRCRNEVQHTVLVITSQVWGLI